MRPTSFSQNNMFSNYPRQWYLQYIKKIPSFQDFCYANAGSTIHKCLQLHYEDKKSLEELKLIFNKLWTDSYKLDKSKIANKKDSYWLMVIEGINKKLDITSTELKIFYPDVVGYLDVVDTKNHTIADWKSSTRSEINEEEYKKQLQFYSYLYSRKFGTLPKSCKVYYLKYPGSKGEMEYIPTEKDIGDIEDWHFGIRKQIDEVIKNDKLPEKCGECNFFCPYKSYCFEDENTLKFKLSIINNYVFVEGKITDILNNQLNKKFSYELKNAFWIKKKKPEANTIIKFWKENKRLIPLGMFHGLVKTLNDYAKFKKRELSLEIIDNRKSFETTTKMPDSLIGKELRDYQEDAIRAFTSKRIAILEIATGAGKSLIMSEIVRKLNLKTLILVNRVELLYQLKETLEESLGIKVGVIRAKEDDIQDITIATIQTIYKNIKKYKDYLSTINFSIMDECHNVNHMSYWKISNHLINTTHRLGLSGTAFRIDGNDMYLNAVNGYISYNLNAKKLINLGWLTRPSIHFIKNYMTDKDSNNIEAGIKTGLINETESYPKYYEGFIKNNKKRNEVIKDIVEKNKGKKILILTKLVEHGQMLSEILECDHIHGGSNKKERTDVFEKFKNEDVNIIVGTISIFSEGIDIPKLDILINASANKGDVKSVQMLGRIMRLFEGKERADYYDFVDEHRFFKLASYARMKIFRKQSHNVEVIDYSKESKNI